MYKLTHMQREVRFASITRCNKCNYKLLNTYTYNQERERRDQNTSFNVFIQIQRALYSTLSSPLLYSNTSYSSNTSSPSHVVQETKSSDLQRLQQQMHKNAFAQYVAQQNAPFTGLVSHTHSMEVPQEHKGNKRLNQFNNNNYEFSLSESNNSEFSRDVNDNKQCVENKNTKHGMLTYEVKPTHNKYIPVSKEKTHEERKEYIRSDSFKNENENVKDEIYHNSNNKSSETSSTHSANRERYNASKENKSSEEESEKKEHNRQVRMKHTTSHPSSYSSSFLPTRYSQEQETVKNLQHNLIVPHMARHAKHHCFALLCKTIRIVHEVKEVLANIASTRYTERKLNIEEENSGDNNNNKESSKMESLLDKGSKRNDYEAVIRERVLQLQTTLREFIPLIDVNSYNMNSDMNNHRTNCSLKINEIWVIDDVDVIHIMKERWRNNTSSKKRNNNNNKSISPEHASFTVKQLYSHLIRDLYSVYKMLSYNFSRYTHISSFQYSHASNQEAQRAYIRTSGALYAIRALLYQLISFDIQNALFMWCEPETYKPNNRQEEEEYKEEELKKKKQHLYSNDESKYYNKNKSKSERAECLSWMQTFKLFKMCIHIPPHELPLFTISNVSTLMQHVNFNKYCSYINTNSNYEWEENSSGYTKSNSSNNYNYRNTYEEEEEYKKRAAAEKEIKYIFHAITSKPFTCEEWLLLRLLMMPSSECFFSSNSFIRNNNNDNNISRKCKNIIEKELENDGRAKQAIWQHERQLFEILRICMTSSFSTTKKRFDKNYESSSSKNYLANPSLMKQDQYSATKQSNREDLRIPFHLGAAFASKLMMSVLTSESETLKSNNETLDADITHKENNNNKIVSGLNHKEENCSSVLQNLSIHHIALLCSAILFYELYNIHSLQVLVASAPRFVEEVELLNGVEVSTVMMSFAKLNYSGEMMESSHKTQDKQNSVNYSDNFYVVLGNHAARLEESLSVTDISLILSSLEHVHMKHDLLRSCFEAMLRTRSVFQ